MVRLVHLSPLLCRLRCGLCILADPGWWLYGSGVLVIKPGGCAVLVSPGGVFFVGVASTEGDVGVASTEGDVGVSVGGTGVAVGTVLVASPGSVPPDASVLVGAGASSVSSEAGLEVGVKVVAAGTSPSSEVPTGTTVSVSPGEAPVS